MAKAQNQLGMLDIVYHLMHYFSMLVKALQMNA